MTTPKKTNKGILYHAMKEEGVPEDEIQRRLKAGREAFDASMEMLNTIPPEENSSAPKAD